MHKPYFLLLLLFVSFTGNGQIEYIRKATKILTSEEFAGRGYTFGGDSLAADFIRKEWKKEGIQPLKKNYYQSFSFPVNTFPNEVILQDQGLEYKVGIDFLMEPESGSFKGKLHVFEVEIVPGQEWDPIMEQVKEVLQSKTFNAFLFKTKYTELQKKDKAVLEQLSKELANYSCVFIQDDSKWNWSVASNQLKFPIVRVKENVVFTKDLHLEVSPVFKPKHNTQNVVAYLPAKKKSKKTFVFTAHYDHLGSIGKKVYFPGANDNASGTAALLALGKYFKENPADFNVLLIAFAGEEAGLLGSEYFVKNPIFPLKKMDFLLNVDIFGSGEKGITVVNGSVFTEAFDLLKNLNKEGDFLPLVKARGKAANSDHYFFTEAGVKSFFIYTEGHNSHYHDIFDTYNELSFDKAEALISLMISFSQAIMR